MTNATLPTPLYPTAHGLAPSELAVLGFLARYSGVTRDGYARHLQSWFTWCHDQHVDPLDATRLHVELFYRWCIEARGNCPSTIGTISTPIRGFYKFACIDDLISKNPAEYARVPKIRVDEQRKTGLDRHDLMKFLQAAELISPRHHAFAYLIGVMAMRVSEACSIRIEDYAETDRGHRVVRFVGKGAKPATMPLTIPVLRAMDAAKGDRTSGHLITTLDGRPMERHAAAGLVRTIAKRAKIDKQLSPHALRRSAITAALDAGAPIRDVQNLARHEDPRTTSQYDLARRSLDRHAVHVLSAYVSV